MGNGESSNYRDGTQDAWIASLRADVAYIRKRVDELHAKVAHMRGFAAGLGAVAGLLSGTLGPLIIKAIFK